jgi:cyclase
VLKTRIIPCLQLVGESLVKTVKFDPYNYIGDPVNTVRIFNELEVDELCFLDIRATIENRPPSFEILSQIAEECFMPLSYGGGIKDADTAKKILSIGFEKIILNTISYSAPEIISEIASFSGVQSVIGSIDVKRNIWGKHQLFSHDGTKKESKDPVAWAIELEKLGVGELLVTSMDYDGTWKGYDIEIIKKISDAVSIPIIANGGAGSIQHMEDAVNLGGASAVALGSMVVYQSKGMGVLVNFPDKKIIESKNL